MKISFGKATRSRSYRLNSHTASHFVTASPFELLFSPHSDGKQAAECCSRSAFVCLHAEDMNACCSTVRRVLSRRALLQQSPSKQDRLAGLELTLPQGFDAPHRRPRRGQDLKLSLSAGEECSADSQYIQLLRILYMLTLLSLVVSWVPMRTISNSSHMTDLMALWWTDGISWSDSNCPATLSWLTS